MIEPAYPAKKEKEMELYREKTQRGGYRRILSGTDDGSTFRVAVPMRCHTVEEAVAWLRPPEVPTGSLRQGEFFFRPGQPPEADDYPVQTTAAGSERQTHTQNEAEFSASHHAEECVAVWDTGNTMFLGRRHVHSHEWTGRPRYFVRGAVKHSEHTTLQLSEWHEVIPNRAHGPFPVRGFGRED